MKVFFKRLDLMEHEFDCLINYIDFEAMEEFAKQYERSIEALLLVKLKNPKKLEVSFKRMACTRTATKVRSEKAKDKIQNAINILRMENKSITHYSIAQCSGVSYNTVKKYIVDIDKVGKIE